MAPTGKVDMLEEIRQFLRDAKSILTIKFTGDATELAAFLDEIEQLRLLITPSIENYAFKHIKTRISGKAREDLDDHIDNIDDLIQSLKKNTRYEDSEIIEGRILALRADKVSLTEFQNQAEELCQKFKRALVMEGISKEKAQQLTIKKARELCAKSTNLPEVRAVIKSTSFKEPIEVITKYITEIQENVRERQILHFNVKANGNYYLNQRGRRGNYGSSGSYRHQNSNEIYRSNGSFQHYNKNNNHNKSNNGSFSNNNRRGRFYSNHNNGQNQQGNIRMSKNESGQTWENQNRAEAN